MQPMETRHYKGPTTEASAIGRQTCQDPPLQNLVWGLDTFSHLSSTSTPQVLNDV